MAHHAEAHGVGGLRSSMGQLDAQRPPAPAPLVALLPAWRRVASWRTRMACRRRLWSCAPRTLPRGSTVSLHRDEAQFPGVASRLWGTCQKGFAEPAREAAPAPRLPSKTSPGLC